MAAHPPHTYPEQRDEDDLRNPEHNAKAVSRAVEAPVDTAFGLKGSNVEEHEEEEEQRGQECHSCKARTKEYSERAMLRLR